MILTPLQFLVIDELNGSKKPGEQLRERLATEGYGRTLAAFYLLMQRMEEANLIAGEYAFKTVEGQRLRYRRYRVLGLGFRALEQTREFYGRPSGVEEAPAW